MTKLLLPFAYDSSGSLVHIDNAQQGQYTCPMCKQAVRLRIGRLPKTHPHYRRSHFAHIGIPNNKCSETFLHKHFKEKCAELIGKNIFEKQKLLFEWECVNCGRKQRGNLLENVADVKIEYDLGVRQPDIALLDSNGEVITVIEIIVRNKTNEEKLKYYRENNIKCINITISDYDECDDIEAILINSEKTKVEPKQICEECKQKTINTKATQSYYRKQENFSYSSNYEKVVKLLEEKIVDKECPYCGGRLVVERGEYKQYVKCIKYPKCNYYIKKIDAILDPKNFDFPADCPPPANRKIRSVPELLEK